MFRRSRPEDTVVPPGSVKEGGGKGRPTPSRKEAEAAARARARGATNKKEAAKLARRRRSEQNARAREAMKSGEERYLPARDQGPVKRLTRNLVDSRLCMAEFLLPTLLAILITQPLYPAISNGLWSATILLVGADTVLLVLKVRREVKRRLPDESTKGTAFYAILRSLQLRFLRLPKPQVKLGQRV